MHIRPLTRRLPARAEAKGFDTDIAFVTMFVEFAMLLQEAASMMFKGE